MDILNHHNNFIEQLKKEKRVKSIDIGFDFSRFLISQINEIDFKKVSMDADIDSIEIFDLNKKEYFFVNCNKKVFQEHLQFIYSQFRDEYHFEYFDWYKSFRSVVKEILKKKFNYDSEPAMNFVARTVSECFIYLSNGYNKYNYKEVYNFLSKKFISFGIPISESKELSEQILQSLYDYNLLITNKSFNFFKETFELSDFYMDIVFNLSSIYVSRIGFNNEIQFNAKIELSNISKMIDNYDSNWNKRNSVSELKLKLNSNYNDLFKLLDNYIIFDIDKDKNFCQNIPDHVLKASFAFFYNKILLNEYCLQLMISSCFNSYSLNPQLRNVLYSHRNLFTI